MWYLVDNFMFDRVRKRYIVTLIYVVHDTKHDAIG